MSGPGIYVHFAFCRSKCLYCDFNSRPGTPAEQSAYVDALVAEIERTPPLGAATVYFGGGTPTVFAPCDLARVLQAVTARFVVGPSAEITLEANPGTVTEASLRALREAGFNRLSLGVQSLRDPELTLLGRAHDAAQAEQAVASARAAGFENLSLDLIRGLPGQKLEHWQETLEGAIALEPDHISAYGLSLEEGTPLREKVERGELPRPRGSGSAHWLDWTVRRLRRAGYRRYEISNYARPGRESRHNLNYWHNGEYIGIGAGAWSYRAGVRSRNVADSREYTRLALAGEELVREAERLGPEEALGEAMMLGLRLTEGIRPPELACRYGIDPRQRYADVIDRLVKERLLVDEHGVLRLTSKGLLVQNAVAVEFLQ
ncbi:MAG: radical SAM family heme chaperone HemW [Armatimonadetes bacterium]|nr:radical SAM family heme chaperone HemW [Armatimonadota bacterium]